MPNRTLTAFDLTALVVGAVVGADIYVAASLTTPLVGASSLLLWLAAGAVAFVVALNFSACAQMAPSEGGAYAYARDAYGERTGFLVGWSILLSQFLGAAIFPTAFVQYLHGFVPGMAPWADALVKAGFIGLVLAMNLIPAKAASRLGAVVGFLKLAPLALVIALGAYAWLHAPAASEAHFVPLVSGGLVQFATAFMVIFWAYTGFEVATLPASEVKNPKRSIPLAIAAGLAFSLLVYLLVNAALLAILPQDAIGASTAPLVEAARVAVGSFLPGWAGAAALFLGAGALLSILGADQANMLGASRLAHALAADGYLPAPFAKLTKSGVPLVALLALAGLALAASIVGGLTVLIGATVFFTAVTFLTTAGAAWRLGQKDPFGVVRSPVVPLLGAAAAVLLMLASGVEALVAGLVLLALGLPIFAHYAPKRRHHGLHHRLRHRVPTYRTVQQQTTGLFFGVAWWVARLRHHERIHTVKRRDGLPESGSDP